MTTLGGYARDYDAAVEVGTRRRAVVLRPYLLTLSLPGTQGPPLVAGDIAELLPEDISERNDKAAADVAGDLTVTVLDDADGTTPLEGAPVTVKSPLGTVAALTDSDGQATFSNLPIFRDAPLITVGASDVDGTKRVEQYVALRDSENAITLIPSLPAGSLTVTVLLAAEGHAPAEGATVTVTPPVGAPVEGETGADGTVLFAAGVFAAEGGFLIEAELDGDTASATKTLTTGANTQSLTLAGGD